MTSKQWEYVKEAERQAFNRGLKQSAARLLELAVISAGYDGETCLRWAAEELYRVKDEQP